MSKLATQAMGTTEHITLLCGVSAAGIALPLMIIYPQSYSGGQYRFGGPDDLVYAKGGFMLKATHDGLTTSYFYSG